MSDSSAPTPISGTSFGACGRRRHGLRRGNPHSRRNDERDKVAMSRYHFFKGTAWVMQRLPRRLAYALAAVLGEVAFAVNAPARRVALSNMRHVLGDGASRTRVRGAVR